MDVRRDVEVTTPQAPTDFLDATALDVSTCGLRVLSGCEFGAGDQITVYWGRHTLVGTVIYCRPEDDGFMTGVKLSPDSHWQNQLFGKVLVLPGGLNK